MKNYNTVAYETVKPGVGLLTLNRPELLNAISWEMVEELHDVLSVLEEDIATRVLIMTGAGRGFCSGTDLRANENGREDAPPPTIAQSSRSQRRIGDVVLHMRKIPQPIVCAVNGVAAGGGFSFSMATDVRVAAQSARFICSFINIGLTAADVGSSYFLTRLIGHSRATELMLTGRPMGAEEAERVGYVSKVVPDGDSVKAAIEVADTMLGKSPFGLRMSKEVLNHSVDSPSLEAALYMENRTQVLAVNTGDFRHAIEAFKEKRPPQFPPEE